MALDPVRLVLPGGLRLIVKENRTTPSVSLIIGIRCGGAVDPAGRDGTAALTARVLDRGTEGRDAADIADSLDGCGASLSAGAGRHQIVVSATCLADDFSDVFALATDVIRRPAFPDAEVATRRTELITAVREDADDPGTVAEDALALLMYPGHPYGRRPEGTVETVSALQRADLVGYHATWFGPATITVVVVGDVDAAQVAGLAAAATDGWTTVPAERPRWPPVVPASARRFEDVPMMNKAQADVAYGLVGITRADPEYYAASVMNNVLGQYGLGGRLGDSIREQQGMAYYVYSSLDASLAEGPLVIRAGVSAANVEKTIASIDAEIESVRRDGLTDKEVDESKRYLIGSLPRQLETNRSIAQFLLSAELFGLGMDHDVRRPGLIASVTRDAAVATARRLLDPARATIVVAGPWARADASVVRW